MADDSKLYEYYQGIWMKILNIRSQWDILIEKGSTSMKSLETYIDQVECMQKADWETWSPFGHRSQHIRGSVILKIRERIREELDDIADILRELDQLCQQMKSLTLEGEQKFLKLNSQQMTSNYLILPPLCDLQAALENVHFYYRNEYLRRKYLFADTQTCQTDNYTRLIKEWDNTTLGNDIKLIFVKGQLFCQVKIDDMKKMFGEVTPNDKSKRKQQMSSEKSILQIWTKCGRCKCLFFMSDTEKHASLCDKLISSNSDLTNVMINESDGHAYDLGEHNYIRDSRYFGSSIIRTTSILDEKKKVDSSWEDAFVTLPMIVLYKCGIHIGGLIVLKNSWNHKRIIRRATITNQLASNEIGLCDITFKCLESNPGDLFSVEVLKESCFAAKRILLTSKMNSNFFQSHVFLEALRSKESGKYFIIGNKIKFNFLGNIYDFIIEEIEGTQHVSVEETFEPKMNLLKESMKNLNIKTSTPIKSLTLSGTSKLSQKKEETTRVFYLTSVTKISISTKETNVGKIRYSYSQIGGLTEQINDLQNIINRAKNSKSKRSCVGVVIHGPPGVGKTLLGRAAAAENDDLYFIMVDGSSDILKKNWEETEITLKDIFARAKNRSPSIILFDKIDSWCLKRTDLRFRQEILLQSILLAEMDKLNEKETTGVNVIVLATIEGIDDIDVPLRRPGRFDMEIELNIPNISQKEEILHKILPPSNCNLSGSDIREIAEISHGFTGMDLFALRSEAVKTKISRDDFTDPSTIVLNVNDLKLAMKNVTPRVMKEVITEFPKIKWDDVGGQEEIKMKLRQTVEWPLKYSEHFKRLGIRPTKGVLLYGPPGCSKTLMAKALATESQLNFIYVKISELFSKFVGESEQAVKKIFQTAKKAAPSIVFFDEIDGLATERGSGGSGGQVESRVLGQLLLEMDNVAHLHFVIVVAATNRPDLIDKALLRPGRLDRKIFVPLPDEETRRQIFHISFRKINFAEDVRFDELVNKTHNYSGADIKRICYLAFTIALRETSMREPLIRWQHLLKALEIQKPSVAKNIILICKKFHSGNKH